MRATATVTNAGQLTLPEEVRKSMEVVPGSRIVFEQKGEDILISVDREEDVFEQFRGIGTPGIGEGREEIQAWIREMRGDL